jgi:predicted enzyme related to lactoylglutathione lyase
MSRTAFADQAGPGLQAGPPAVVHLELHTGDLSAASDFYARLLNWRTERIRTDHGCYTALGVGGEVGAGVVECTTARPLWIPYVEVDRIDLVTARARRLGASVLLGPCEGPAGWRSVVSAPEAAEVALWQSKEPR